MIEFRAPLAPLLPLSTDDGSVGERAGDAGNLRVGECEESEATVVESASADNSTAPAIEVSLVVISAVVGAS